MPEAQVINPDPAKLSDQFMADQITNPALPAGGQQVYTPQEVKPGETVDNLVSQIAKPAAPAPATVQAPTAPIAPPAPISAAQVTASQSTAQTGEVTPESTVRGQMTNLMKDVKEGNAPWADAAMRKATEAMQARGLGQSSMAGAAITQSVIEAALPIAQLDAKTFGDMNLQNIRNKQEAMLSNTAAENVAKQLNAASTNDVTKYMSDLKNSILKFNVEQKASMDQFNAGQTNADTQFQEKMANAVDVFNATNAQVIATSNAEWRRSINTANTAGVNATNSINAQNEFNISAQAMANLWQQTRDLLNFTNSNSENEKDRALSIVQYSMQRDAYLHDVSEANRQDLVNGIGGFIANIFRAL
jgi:hypothetical protein